jgi:hypothetical protein
VHEAITEGEMVVKVQAVRRNVRNGLEMGSGFGYEMISVSFGETTYMLGIEKIAEKRIQEAIDRGELKDLPGQGAPLHLEDDSRIPEDLRLAYKILKNADCLPPELEARKEIRQMEDLLAQVPDEREKYRLVKKINFMIMKLNMMGRRPLELEDKEIYYQRVVDKLTTK